MVAAALSRVLGYYSYYSYAGAAASSTLLLPRRHILAYLPFYSSIAISTAAGLGSPAMVENEVSPYQHLPGVEHGGT
jgi:hypothetical protein